MLLPTGQSCTSVQSAHIHHGVLLSLHNQCTRPRSVKLVCGGSSPSMVGALMSRRRFTVCCTLLCQPGQVQQGPCGTDSAAAAACALWPLPLALGLGCSTARRLRSWHADAR